jgi:hypothetical protein
MARCLGLRCWGLLLHDVVIVAVIDYLSATYISYQIAAASIKTVVGHTLLPRGGWILGYQSRISKLSIHHFNSIIKKRKHHSNMCESTTYLLFGGRLRGAASTRLAAKEVPDIRHGGLYKSRHALGATKRARRGLGEDRGTASLCSTGTSSKSDARRT